MNLAAAVADFCRTIGLPAAPLPLALRFEKSGLLVLEEQNDNLVASLHRTAPRYRAGVAVAALRAVHPDRNLPYAVRAGFRGDETLVFQARVQADRVEPSLLEHVLTTLVAIADSVEVETS